jgi:hypothetical protein
VNIFSQFKSLDHQNKRYVSFGVLIALLVALPLSIWAITTGTFDIRNRAQETNSCGGTCGSNYNCNAELYCYSGFCRNPFCKDSTNCVCPTASPTASASATPTLIPKASPTATASATPTASASATPVLYATSSPTPSPEIKTTIPYVLIIGALLIILIILIVLTFKKKNKGPKNPISQISPVAPIPPTSPEQGSVPQKPALPVDTSPTLIQKPPQQFPTEPNPPIPSPPVQDQY